MHRGFGIAFSTYTLKYTHTRAYTRKQPSEQYLYGKWRIGVCGGEEAGRRRAGQKRGSKRMSKRERKGGERESESESESPTLYRARVVIADCVGWEPGALSNGTERELRCPSRAAVQLGDAGLSITKIYTVSFVGQARLYLWIVEELGCEARWFRRIAMRCGVKSNNFSSKKNTGKTGSIACMPLSWENLFVRYYLSVSIFRREVQTSRRYDVVHSFSAMLYRNSFESLYNAEKECRIYYFALRVVYK